MVISISHKNVVVLCLVQKIFSIINATRPDDKLKISGNVIVEDLEGSPIRVKIPQHDTEVVFEKFTGADNETAEAEGYVSYQDKDYLFGYLDGRVAFRGFREHEPEEELVTA